MKSITVYWRNDPQEMDLVTGVDYVSVGPDGEQLIATDEGAQTIRGIVRANEGALWVDSTDDLDPSMAADLIHQWIPQDRRQDSLRKLIQIVAQENPQSSAELEKKLEDRL